MLRVISSLILSAYGLGVVNDWGETIIKNRMLSITKVNSALRGVSPREVELNGL